jgi:hypothetical protein
VIVVGNSASGIDLSAQIATVCQTPVLVSEKEKPNPSTPSTPAAVDDEPPSIRNVPEIAEFLPAQRGVRFADGIVETDIDAVVFCTGYFYSFPFLRSLTPPVVTDGSHVPGLYQHILSIHEPTLVFIGIPQRVVPFPLAEAQSAWVARLFSGRLALPPTETMRSWEEQLIRERGGPSKLIHNLAFPRDVQYINKLHAMSLAAERIPALENDGVGKMPPYWGAEKAWVRERVPLIKLAARALGEKRHSIKTLEQLGFDYQMWKTAEGARDASAEETETT